MYHLDLAFCPLDERRAMVCPAAFDDASAAALLALVPEPLVLTEEEALTFCANSIVIGRTILMPACPDRVRAQLEEWGFEVVLVDLSEFHKGGGSIRCLTNPLDVTIGRDLPAVPGGEVAAALSSREGQLEDGIRARAGGTTGADPVSPKVRAAPRHACGRTPATPIVLTSRRAGGRRPQTKEPPRPMDPSAHGAEGAHPRGTGPPVSPDSAGLDRIPHVTSLSLRSILVSDRPSRH